MLANQRKPSVEAKRGGTINSQLIRRWADRLPCRTIGLALCLLLSGCETIPEGEELQPQDVVAVAVPAESVTKQPEPPVRPAPEDYPVASFEGDSLYQLLVAEVAGFRSDYELALEKYVAAAETTQDPGVAARATRLGLYLKQDESALRTAEIWAEKDPDDIDAHRHSADLLLRAGRLEDAMVHMESIKRLGGLAKFDVFAYRSANLSEQQRLSLLEAITEMLDRYPGDEQLMFSRAVLLEQTGALEASLELTNALLLVSENPNVVILKMSLLTALDRTADALAFLQSQLEQTPDNRRLRLIYARLLFEGGDLDAAKQQYTVVLQQTPNDGDVLFALALIALEQNDDAAAKRHFERMVRWNQRVGEAHYYLGGIAERESDPAKALQAYLQAGGGYEYLPAQARIVSILADDARWEEARDHLARQRIARPDRVQQLIMIEAQLLAERGMPDEALDFLEQSLAQDPENIDLLYFRAMTGQRFDRLDILEADLRRVIAIDPDNADALNALGYTLADQTERYEEAFELIQQALDLKPDEPAFIDSMGWVQYRLGNYTEAITYLRRALSLFDNDEVAAHLGEVLWVVGEQEEARQIWDAALQKTPASEILKDVMQRFLGE